jgi:hypothetical protein
LRGDKKEDLEEVPWAKPQETVREISTQTGLNIVGVRQVVWLRDPQFKNPQLLTVGPSRGQTNKRISERLWSFALLRIAENRDELYS